MAVAKKRRWWCAGPLRRWRQELMAAVRLRRNTTATESLSWIRNIKFTKVQPEQYQSCGSTQGHEVEIMTTCR